MRSIGIIGSSAPSVSRTRCDDMRYLFLRAGRDVSACAGPAAGLSRSQRVNELPYIDKVILHSSAAAAASQCCMLEPLCGSQLRTLRPRVRRLWPVVNYMV